MEPQVSNWIEPASTRALPDPVELRRMITEKLEAGYAELRKQQGDVHVPEDTFGMQRALAATRERFADWAAAFRDGAKRLGQMQEEQLIEAVGEQVSAVSQVGIDGEPEYRGTGVPNQGLTIPDAAGDVRLSVDFKTERDFDQSQLIAVVATRVATTADVTLGVAARQSPSDSDLATLIADGIREFLAMGKFEPQVTKVSAYGKQVARQGEDHLAGVLSGAVTARKVYQGVSMKRS